jgi:3-oxoacyl-[acyl-carrier-protein] synthase-3
MCAPAIASSIVPPILVGPVEGVAIVGSGTAFPERVLTNTDVLRHIAPFTWPDRKRPIDEEQIAFLATSLAETMGVRERAWAHLVGTPLDHSTELTTLALMEVAAKRALEDAKIDASELSLVLCATSTPHRMTSTIAAPLGHTLGATAACADLRAGCAGGILGLSTAALYLSAGSGPVLLVGGETFSKVIPPNAGAAAMALGDGAGAIVLARRSGSSLLSASFETDGGLARLVTTDGALPPTPEEIVRGGYLLSGAPEELTATVPAKYFAAITAALTRAELTANQVDVYVPHQTSVGLIHAVADKVGVAREATFVNVPRHANVGAAGWIVAMAEARAEGRVRAGMNVLVAAVGGGMSWGAAVVRT